VLPTKLNDERVRKENALDPPRSRSVLLDQHCRSTSPSRFKYPNLRDGDRSFGLPPGSELPRTMVGKPAT